MDAREALMRKLMLAGPAGETMQPGPLTPYVTTQDLPPNMPRAGEAGPDYERWMDNILAGALTGIGGTTAAVGGPAGMAVGLPMMGAGGAGFYNANRPEIDKRSYMLRHFREDTNRLPGYTPWDWLRQGGQE